MDGRPRVLSILLACILGVALAECKAVGEGDSAVAIVKPRAEQVFAWGQNAPEIRLEAQAQLAPNHSRAFITVNLLTPEQQVVDRISLYDDGTHGDVTPADGTFTNSGRPPRDGTYLLRARMEVTDTRTGKKLERWSDVVPIVVRRIPYCRILHPRPGEKVGDRAAVGATLLVGDNRVPYRPKRDEPLRIRAWSQPQAEAQVPERFGERFEVRFTLPRPAKYQLFVAVQSLQNGQWVESEPDGVLVEATAVSMLPLYLFGFLLVAYLLLPSRKVRLYRHELEVRSKDMEPVAVIVAPKLLQEVKHSVGGRRSDTVVRDDLGTLFTLTSVPGERRIRVRVEGEQSSEESLGEESSALRDASGKYSLHYRNLEYLNTLPLPYWKLSTLTKRTVLVLAILTLAWQVFNYIAYTAMTRSL